jgi:hypothetical protein
VIEPPVALLEEEVEVSSGDGVVASRMPLGLVPEVLDANNVNLAVSEWIALLTDIHQAVIGFPTAGHHHALKTDLSSDNILKSLDFYIWNDLGEDASATFENATHGLFLIPRPRLRGPGTPRGRSERRSGVLFVQYLNMIHTYSWSKAFSKSGHVPLGRRAISAINSFYRCDSELLCI